ncbi:MAG TPA: YIP1 family protein, partial [Terriglobales bacterium]
TPEMNEVERVACTFYDPGRTMSDIARNASWWVPWVIISIVSLCFVFMIEKRVGWDQAIERQIMKDPKAAEQFDRMPPEQRERALELGTNIGKGFAYGSPVMLLLANAIMAGILLGVFNFGFGAQLKFAQLMAISFYASLPSIIKSVLAMVTLYLIEPDGFQLDNPVASNLGVLVDSSHKFLFRFASCFDIFSLWVIGLMALGVSRNTPKVKFVPAFISVFILFVLAKLAGLGG